MKGNVTASIVTAVTVAMILIIGLVVFSNFHTNARTQTLFETAAVNESVNSTVGAIGTKLPNTFTLDHVPAKTGTLTMFVQNSTITTTLPAANYSLNSTETGLIQVNVLGNWNTSSLGVYASYTYYDGDAFDQIESTADQAYSGFSLGAILPLVLFAVAIIGIIMAAFTFGRR